MSLSETLFMFVKDSLVICNFACGRHIFRWRETVKMSVDITLKVRGHATAAAHSRDQLS
jgi:hypothetical protein